MIRWAFPEALQLLWLLPLLFIGLVVLWRRHQQRMIKVLGTKAASFLTASLAPSRRKVRIFLELLTFVFFILALARPQTGKSLTKVKNHGIELVLAVDISRSMMAEDVKPSRLAHLKKELSRFLDLSMGDRVGLIAFAGSAIVLSPMTMDLSAIKMYLQSLSSESVMTQGTEFKKMLKESLEIFNRGGVDVEEDQGRVTRVVLIASDGEDNEVGALDAAKYLVDKGVRLFSLGFGTESGGPIPVRDSIGNVKGYKKDRQGNVVITKTRGKFLKELAQVGKGSFYHATFGGSEVQAIRDEINALGKSEMEADLITNYDEKYQVFLFLGLLSGLFSLLVSERKRTGRIWMGRFEVAGS